jgi:transcriptional regulator with XRE-family HTH domain
VTAEPPAPPEAELLYRARSGLGISIREAARRASISENRWRQVEAGYQVVRAGIRVPARATAATLARMALAVTVTPSQLTAAGREDAAAILEEIRRREGGTVSVPPARAAPPDRKLPVLGLDADEEEALQPYLLELTRELYAAAGLQLGPGREVPDLPEVEELLASLPGSRIFRDPVEIRTWDTIVLNTWEKKRLIATLRMWRGDAAEQSGERNAG